MTKYYCNYFLKVYGTNNPPNLSKLHFDKNRFLICWETVKNNEVQTHSDFKSVNGEVNCGGYILRCEGIGVLVLPK